MGWKTVIRRVLTILIVVTINSYIIINGVVAQEGPKTISGRVYTSEGENPGDGFEGTYTVVIVEHKGVKTNHVDLTGLERDDYGDYWFSVVIPDGKWDAEDTYWISVDGTGWGDLNHTCSGHGNPNIKSWKMDAMGTQWQDVDTVLTVDDDDGDGSSQMMMYIMLAVMAVIVMVLVFLITVIKRSS